MADSDLHLIIAVIAALVVAMLGLSLVSVCGVWLMRWLGLSGEPLPADIFAPPQVIPQRRYDRAAALQRGNQRRALQARYDRLARAHQQYSLCQETCFELAASGHNTQALEGRLEQLAEDMNAVLPTLAQEADASQALAQRAQSLHDEVCASSAAGSGSKRNRRMLLLLALLLALVAVVLMQVWLL